MATDNTPQNPFLIKLRPNQFQTGNFDPVIKEHGQWCRWMKAQPCPFVIENSGHHSSHCKICHGRGAIYHFDCELFVYNERPPHGSKNTAVCQDGVIKPFITPIKSVKKVIAFRSEAEGGTVDIEVDSFTDTEIFLKPDFDKFCTENGFPEPFLTLIVDYSYDVFETVTETFKGDGKRRDFKFDMQIPPQQSGTNEFDATFAIAEVESIETDGEKLDHQQFFAETIYFEFPPKKDQEFTITVKAAVPHLWVIQPLSTNYARQMGWDMTNGNMRAVVPGNINLGKGDIITALNALERQSELIRRGKEDFDLLPYYDVWDFDNSIPIIDVKGRRYKKDVDFRLYDYNKVLWMGDNRPPTGTNYSVVFFERNSYRVYTSNAELRNNENKHLPRDVQLERLQRRNPAPIQPGTKGESRPVGDWARQHGGVV